MSLNINFTKLKTSWTKYDIVQVMDAISSEEKIDRYKKKKIGINEPILRSFLGIQSVSDATPSYWIEIQNYPSEKKLFSLLSVIFTHGQVVKWFADNFSRGNMKGVAIIDKSKPLTNLRSALVEAGASKASYRRAKEVPYDFSPVFQNGEVGKLFKQVLNERLSRAAKRLINEQEFYTASFDNKFPSALSLTETEYKEWLEGKALTSSAFIVDSLLRPTDFKKKFDEFVRKELIKYDLDFMFDLRYEKGFFLILKQDKFPSLEMLLGHKLANFQLLHLSNSAAKSKYIVIANSKNDSPIVSTQTLLQLQNTLAIDLKELHDNPIFITATNFLRKNYIAKISSVKIKNFYSIKDMKFSDLHSTNEVYLLGENGDGKSLVLMGIYLAFNQFFITEETAQEKTGKIKDLIQDNNELLLLGQDEFGEIYGKSRNRYLKQFYGYGAHRGRYSTDNADQYGFMTLFDGDQVLINPVSWLKDRKLAELQSEKNGTPSTGSDSLEKSVIQLSITSLQDMLNDILEKNVVVIFEGSEVFFLEKGSRLRFDQLSEGYKSVIIFVCDLIFRLTQSQSEVKSIQELKGVVLVDEIDLHLHPKWQFIVVRKLRALFPNIQFVFSTHSPAIIQGASEDALIYRVYRNAIDGKTNISECYYRKNLDHLMINSLITSPLFGMESARMDSDNDNADTSDSYIISKLNKKIIEELDRKKKDGQGFVSEEEIDKIINETINLAAKG